MNPVYRAHYALWVHWWPLWRKISSKGIRKQWDRYNLVRDGFTFLDYGCGTGDFTVPAAEMVTSEGQVYALDYFPRQLEIVRDKAKKAGLKNIKTILSRKNTGLPDESVDVIWMCDVLHEIKERRQVIKEAHRVLKKKGTLAIHDGMKDKTLDYTRGLFSLWQRNGKFLTFTKQTA